jgi:hypothetical protein
VEIEHKHPFTHDEARERLKALADYLTNRHGMNIQWTDADRFHLTGKYTVVNLDVSVQVGPNKINVTGPDPGLLLRGAAKAYIARKVSEYLSPDAPLDTLRRA